MDTLRYPPTAIALHWLMALLIFAAFPLGIYMHELPLSPAKLQLYSYHKWLGITVLALIVLRLGWRLRHVPLPLPEHMPSWQRRASAATHHLLYLLMFVVPMSGWLMSSAKGFKTVWLGVLPLPDLIEKNKELGARLAEWHEALNIALLLLVALHLAAVVKHQFIDRDPLLLRMAFRGWRP
jgi:cytochrome b561